MGTIRKPADVFNGLVVKTVASGSAATDSDLLTISLGTDGETSNTDRTYIKGFRGDLVLTSGADQLDNTFPAGPFNNVVLAYNESIDGESHEERLETTKVGIHVGDDQTGTYVAGGNMSVTQTGWGMAFGQDHVVAGHNNFVGGDGTASSTYGTSAQSDNCFLMGYALRTEKKVTNSFIAGSYSKITSGSTISAVDGAAAIGHLCHASADGAVAMGQGHSTSIFTLASGQGAFAGGRASMASANTSFAFGRRQTIDSFVWRPEAKATDSVVFGPCKIESDCQGAFAAGAANHIGNSGAPDYSLTGPDADYGFAIGKYNYVTGDYSGALGYLNKTSGGNANIAIGQELKTPTMENDSETWISGNGQIVVGQFNNITKEYSSSVQGQGNLYTHGFVNPLHFSVGTGTSAADRYTSFAIGPRSSTSLSSSSGTGFCGIIMEALANSPDYTGDSAAGQGGVPIGGLYRYAVGGEGSGVYLVGIRMS